MRYLVLKSAITARWVVAPATDPAVDRKRRLYLGTGRQTFATRGEARRFLRPLAQALRIAA